MHSKVIAGVLTTVAVLGAMAGPAPGANRRYTARVTNAYYPLLPGMRWEYRGVKDGRPLRDAVRVTDRGEVGITVRDCGPGVAPEVRERIFDCFFRADPSRARSTGGGGLGLAITREIASAHAARVWVEDAGTSGASAFSLALARLEAPLS